MLPNLKESPLKTAHEDAERMADKLAKDHEFQRLGQPIFVVHDLTAAACWWGRSTHRKTPGRRGSRGN